MAVQKRKQAPKQRVVLGFGLGPDPHKPQTPSGPGSLEGATAVFAAQWMSPLKRQERFEREECKGGKARFRDVGSYRLGFRQKLSSGFKKIAFSVSALYLAGRVETLPVWESKVGLQGLLR